jgi:CheY-like chemotaxis protein
MSKIILVADDNAIVRREICRLLLRETECEVFGAEHGLDAIEKAQQLHPNLIILDLSMPVMNGIDAARVLRLRMPTVPIIVFTSYTSTFLEEELRSAGVTEVVSKSDVFLLTLKARILLRQDAA